MAITIPSQFQASNAAPWLIVLSALLAITVWVRRDRRLDKMPGPQGWPLIGIGISLPQSSIFKMHAWALQHGEVFKLRVGWYNWVVLNSPQAVKEILDKQVRQSASHALQSLPNAQEITTRLTSGFPAVPTNFIKTACASSRRCRGWGHAPVHHAIRAQMACLPHHITPGLIHDDDCSLHTQPGV